MPAGIGRALYEKVRARVGAGSPWLKRDLLTLALAAVALAGMGCGGEPGGAEGVAGARRSVAGALGAGRGGRIEGGASGAGSGGGAGPSADRGFARAFAPRAFRFPHDHGPHPEFRTEWWYYTGNLAAADGRRFGFQLTFFRSALLPPEPSSPARASAWAARQVFLAHFALTDVTGGRFHAAERWERAALGLAGAQAEPFRVWTGPWSAAAVPRAATDAASRQATAGSLEAPPATGLPAAPESARLLATPNSAGLPAAPSGGSPAVPAIAGTPAAPAIAGTPYLRLRAATPDAAIDLNLLPGTPPVAQGDRGLSRKSAEPGNASYYYSLPRMPASGTVRAGGESFQVSGAAWMDREWSTSALAPGEVGWDWFALQLAGGREIMFYRLRRRDGGADPASAGTLIDATGGATPLSPAAVDLHPVGSWRSARTGVRYPAGWRLTIRPPGSPPAALLELSLRPLLADQELDLSFRYWEGAVAVTGSENGAPVTGHGYVEMTGYDEPAGAAPGGASEKTRAAPSR